MVPITHAIRADLLSLWNDDYVQRARRLNEEIGACVFLENTLPLHYVGNREAGTVMVMLYPAKGQSHYRFSLAEKPSYESFEDFLAEHLKRLEDFGSSQGGSPFDLKTAAFLHDSDDPSLAIPDRFWESVESKEVAKRNVLRNKLQLQLFPFNADGLGSLGTRAGAGANFQAVEPYLLSLLTELTRRDRSTVVFCGNPFEHLFRAASDCDRWKGVFSFSSPLQINEGKLSLRFSPITLRHDGKCIHTGIAHTFNSQALPNAFEKMRRYGLFCMQEVRRLQGA